MLSTSAEFYLERAITKAQTVQICAELTRSFPTERWAPEARFDGFLAASDTQFMRLGNNNRGGWRWPHVSSTSLETWAAHDTMIAVPAGARYHMTFFGMSRAKLNAVKHVLTSHGFIFYRGTISASRLVRLGLRHRAEVAQCFLQHQQQLFQICIHGNQRIN